MEDFTINDMYYLQLPTGGPTQGDVWANMPCDSFEEKLCTGLIITPRCDFAHSKSPVINYLPIISLDKYIRTMGLYPLIEQAINETIGAIRDKSSTLMVDALFELDVPVDEIAYAARENASSMLIQENKRHIEKAIAEFNTKYDRISLLREAMEARELSDDQVKLINKKRLTAHQRDIIRNNSSDTYFLPPCTSLLIEPSIVLLRHILTCPTELMDNTTHNISSAKTKLRSPQRLLRLESPFIESLMTKFAALFMRVGTRDLPDAAVSSFILFKNGEA